MKLEIDSEFKKFVEVNANRSIICALLNHGGSQYVNIDEFNWIRKSIVKDDMVSYLPVKKYDQFKSDIGFDPFQDGIGRMQVKAGKFVNKILKRNIFEEFKINDVEIEKFVNLLKSDSHRYEGCEFKILEGSDINAYYSENKYHMEDCGPKGTIWSSCMRHTNMSEFFNLYRDSAKMLALFTPDNTIRGRALLWNAFDPIKKVEYKVMDRIYYYDESDTQLFIKWANDNGYITKAYQDAHNYNIFMVNGEYVNLELQVNIPEGSYESYPYLDTFKFFCSKLKCIRNFNRLGHTYCLIQTNGRAEESSVDSEEIPEEYSYDEYDDSNDDYESTEVVLEA